MEAAEASVRLKIFQYVSKGCKFCSFDGNFSTKRSLERIVVLVDTILLTPLLESDVTLQCALSEIPSTLQARTIEDGNMVKIIGVKLGNK